MVRPKTILLVDDEVSALIARRGVLENIGYHVLIAENAYQALRLFSRRDIDLAVLDYYLPDTDGAVLAVAMRLVKSSVPLILHSTSLTLPQQAISAVDAFVAKGENPLNLIETIQNVLGSEIPRNSEIA
jgi:DNA-binding response OmpR family regulator